MRGNIIKKRSMSFAFEKTLHCKLVPVQYREHKNDLFKYIAHGADTDDHKNQQAFYILGYCLLD